MIDKIIQDIEQEIADRKELLLFHKEGSFSKAIELAIIFGIREALSIILKNRELQ